MTFDEEWDGECDEEDEVLGFEEGYCGKSSLVAVRVVSESLVRAVSDITN